MKLQYKRDLWVFTTPTNILLGEMEDQLTKCGYTPVKMQGFVYGKGTIPILLVAHADTVFEKPPKKRGIFYDYSRQVLWSPDGLGADDRAGILGILWLLQGGCRPYVLITTGEENGGIGAYDAVETLPVPDVKCIIELDREGCNQAVFYNDDNLEFQDYIVNKWGFSTEHGTFTDISILCPYWEISGVNLSCGYYNQHRQYEYLRLNDLRSTVHKVRQMLQSPPQERFIYKELRYHTWEGGNYEEYYDDDQQQHAYYYDRFD